MRAQRLPRASASTITIVDAIDDPQLFAPWFRDRKTWAAWFAFLKTLFALPMDASERAMFAECTGRDQPPVVQVLEAWLVCGRRAGKSFILALVAVFLATFRNYEPFLAPGERATIVVIAADRKQARIIFRYVLALLSQVPMLAHLVQRQTQEQIDLSNRVTIEVHTASYRRTRGYAVAAALLDEVAFWPSEEAAEPDTEIIAALRPGMATIPNALLLCGSSPYARKGALWQAFSRHFGKPSPALVWKAPTRTMNPTVPQAIIDAATEADPSCAAAEYGAEFRRDIEAFITREAVEACVDDGVFERPFESGIRYVGFVDPSGGSSDSFTLGIAHQERDTSVLDAVREVKPPFSPEAVVREFASLLKTYRIARIGSDRYAGEWPREQFRKHGVTVEPSDRSKSEIYVDLLPLINSRRASLLDNQRLVAQLVGLERRTARSGKESIDSGPNGHEDLINAAAGALTLAASKRQGPLVIPDEVLAKSAIPVPRVRSVQRVHFR